MALWNKESGSRWWGCPSLGSATLYSRQGNSMGSSKTWATFKSDAKRSGFLTSRFLRSVAGFRWLTLASLPERSLNSIVFLAGGDGRRTTAAIDQGRSFSRLDLTARWRPRQLSRNDRACDERTELRW